MKESTTTNIIDTNAISTINKTSTRSTSNKAFQLYTTTALTTTSTYFNIFNNQHRRQPLLSPPNRKLYFIYPRYLSRHEQYVYKFPNNSHSNLSSVTCGILSCIIILKITSLIIGN